MITPRGSKARGSGSDARVKKLENACQVMGIETENGPFEESYSSNQHPNVRETGDQPKNFRLAYILLLFRQSQFLA
jgi:hypothetical protein